MMDDAERQGRMRRWGWAACGFVAAFVAAGVVRVATRPAPSADERALEELNDILDEVPPPMPESAPPRDVFGHLGDGTHEPVPPPTFPRGVQGVVASTHVALGRVVIDRGACRTAPVESVVIRDGGSGLRGKVVEASDRWVTVELESRSAVSGVSVGDFVLFDPPR